MKRYLLPVVALLVVAAVVPAGAVRVANTPITHTQGIVFQAYPGASTQVGFAGYAGFQGAPISAAPGILWIAPGQHQEIIPGTTQVKTVIDWSNFVAARDPAAYAIKDVQLRKVVPTSNQCLDIFPARTIVQQGSANIRTWWPLMYEKPGTVWTLSVLWGTTTARQFPGEPDKAWVHQDVWTWMLDANEASLRNLLILFHELPYGKDEVPLISDEPLYADLVARLDAIVAAPTAWEKASLLGDFELLVSNHCIYSSPPAPYPSGAGRGLGIANSEENPACCKILLDAGWLLAKYGAAAK